MSNDDTITRRFSLHFAVDQGLWVVWTDRPILTWGSGENALAACADFFSSLKAESDFLSDSDSLGESLQEELEAMRQFMNELSEEDFVG